MALAKKAEYFWPLLWAAASLSLAGVLVLEDQYSRPTVGEGAGEPAPVAQAKLLPAFRLAPEPQAGAQTLERPLFVPERRPAPPPPPPAPVAFKKGQFVLQGTTIVGPLAIALLKEVSTGTTHRLEKGGEIQGLTLAEVASEQVVLRAGGESETLALLVVKGAGNPAAAVEHGPFGSPAAADPSGRAGTAAPPGAQPGTPAAPLAATTDRSPAGPRTPEFGPGRAGPMIGAGFLPSTVVLPTPGSPGSSPKDVIAPRFAAPQPQPPK